MLRYLPEPFGVALILDKVGSVSSFVFNKTESNSKILCLSLSWKTVEGMWKIGAINLTVHYGCCNFREIRLHLRNAQINLAFPSVCTIFARLIEIIEIIWTTK